MANNSVISLVDLVQEYTKQTTQNDALVWLQEHVLPCHYSEFIEKYKGSKKINPQIQVATDLNQSIKKEMLDATTINLGEKGKILNDITDWNSIYQLAKNAGAKFPEVVCAQWALESGWGKHISGQNNFFGLKGTGTSVGTKEYINNQWVTIRDQFINFPTAQSCVEYLVNRWYKDYKGYKGVNRAATRNECARLLCIEGYATDPKYAEKLQQILDQKYGVPTGEGVIKEKVLGVPYEYQNDNKSGTGYRECFSSTCAMIARYWKKITNDDQYNLIRGKFGDTTLQAVQVKTLQSLGLDAKFINNGNGAFLETQIRNGFPVAVGWLHKGSVNQPSGGGHWSCCIGFDETNFIFNDPNGKADMVNGGYLDTSAKAGAGVKYKKEDWLKRWEVDGKNSGWAIVVKPL